MFQQVKLLFGDLKSRMIVERRVC